MWCSLRRDILRKRKASLRVSGDDWRIAVCPFWRIAITKSKVERLSDMLANEKSRRAGYWHHNKYNSNFVLV